MARAYFESQLQNNAEGNSLVREGTVSSPLNNGGETVHENDRPPVKAVWIRLLNRHRLDRKIELVDWIKDFEALAKKARL
jgi:hypothetical protein